ncbi:cupredoxin domain-containing protein [Granulicella paludicola]|uniref:cytochrome C oxidase subunit II n=1 Tax=Granulicella paludicola TaxID=474951 RepID=UPI0021E0AE40|nr:cytochrome C oxidase subunit II [Granulicella paludicola]
MTLAVANTPGHGWFLPRDAALHGPALDTHLLLNLWIVLGLAALAHVLLLAGLAVRRRSEGTSVAMQEYLPLVVLIAVFGWLAVRSQQLWSAQRYVGAAPEAMQVEVTGEQFAWYFRYPGEDAAFGQTKFSLISAGSGNPLGIDPVDEKGKDDIVTSQLVLPAGREVDLTLRSLDVIHGFSVPEMRLKQNAVPGQASHLHFTPTAPGEYAILCTQVCGLGHYRMQAVLRVVTADEFETWTKTHEVQR